jgi:hypothetical protein
MSNINRILVVSVMAAWLTGCGANTDSLQSGQSVKMATVNVEVVDNPSLQTKLLNLLLPKAYAEITASTACFKRLRFKFAESEEDNSTDYEVNEDVEDNVDFYLGEVDMTQTGAVLGSIEIPAGDYRRIEVDLEDKCAGGKSLTIDNSSGSYSTSDRISVRFEGNFTAEDGATISLNINKIVDAIDAYNGTGSIKNAIESVSGSF